MNSFRKYLINKMVACFGKTHPYTKNFAKICEDSPDDEMWDRVLDHACTSMTTEVQK